jgi:hypothetical protein
MERLRHRSERFTVTERHRRCEPQRACQRRFVEPEEERGGDCGADDSARPGDMPAAVVVLGRDRDPGAELRLASDGERDERARAARARFRSECDKRRERCSAGMDDRREVRVVEVVDVRGEARRKRREEWIEAFGPPGDRDRGRSAEFRAGGDDRVDTRVAGRSAENG